MRLFLAPGVHVAQVRGDIVFLDTLSDTYFCLGAAAQRIALVETRAHLALEVADEAAAGQLLEAGLLAPEGAARQARRPPPKPPTASCRLTGQGARPSASTVLQALWLTRAVSRQFRERGFNELLAGPAADPDLRASPALIAAVAEFEQLRPWLPLQGECLLRSFHLRSFLRARGLDARWVFGVRTWPFGAHCWLQAGEVALDDDLERLSAYQPMLAV